MNIICIQIYTQNIGFEGVFGDVAERRVKGTIVVVGGGAAGEEVQADDTMSNCREFGAFTGEKMKGGGKPREKKNKKPSVCHSEVIRIPGPPARNPRHAPTAV